MVLTVVVLNNKEEFIEYLNTDYLRIENIEEKYQLKSINVEYYIEDIEKAKKLFQIGNKLWVQGYPNSDDCLYVINTSIKRDYFKENTVTFEAEEVLVELNHAPFFSQTDLTTSNGFKISKINNEDNVTVNYAALNNWFGDYFQIGVVQACLSSYLSKISPSGTMTKMQLLRYIEEETGNVFVTRYEKDVVSNVIHRYLDFLNPKNSSKEWELNIEYRIPELEVEATLDAGESVVDESEDIHDEDDIVQFPEINKKPPVNLNDLVFNLKNNSGEVLLSWNANDIGLNNNAEHYTIKLTYNNPNLTINCNGKKYNISQDVSTSSLNSQASNNDNVFTTIASDPTTHEVLLGNNSIFEIYDNASQQVIYKYNINPTLGDVHTDILDLTYNVENIEYHVDESDTFNAIAPIINFNDNSDSNSLSKADISKIINKWVNLKITKGDIVPMIVQKITLPLQSGYNLSTRYYSRPLKPNDQAASGDTPAQYEYWVGTAYWRAPFTKQAGEIYVSDDENLDLDYNQILGRPDTDKVDVPSNPKIGSVETSEEDIYAIYNAVAMKLKNKRTPQVDVDVSIQDYKNNKFNDYSIHDKVYIKVPGFERLITANVLKTSRNAHDAGENKVELTNYSINNKVVQKRTQLTGKNVSLKYPSKGELKVKLTDEEDQPLKGRLLSFTLYLDENGSLNFTGKAYSRKTDSNGEVKLKIGYNPGKYRMNVLFNEDEEYSSVEQTFKITVGGIIVKNKSESKSNSKSKSKTKTVIKKRYWSKCGLSPDKKRIVSIAQPSGYDSNKYKYNQLYETVFKNYCPECKRSGTLRFDGGKANKCITSAGAHGRGYKIGVPEHEITCIHCDSDFCGVTGTEKDTNHSTRLKTVKKPKKSSKTEFHKLTKGKLVYDSVKKVIKTEKNTTNNGTPLTRNSSNTGKNYSKKLSNTIINKAKNIVGGSTGLSAAKKIAKWISKNISWEDRDGFYQSPETTLKRKKGNCCCQADLFIQMCDATGVTSKYKIRYVHIHKGKNGHVFAKINKKYVDTCLKNPWGHYKTGKYGKPPGHQTVYPRLPFERNYKGE